MKFKFSIFCFAMLALNAPQAKAEESQFIYEGRIDALYGYNMPSNRYKHNSPRDKTIYNLNLNLGWEKEFNDEWEVLMKAKEEYYKSAGKVLLKDL